MVMGDLVQLDTDRPPRDDVPWTEVRDAQVRERSTRHLRLWLMGHSYREIGEITGESYGLVHTDVKRALSRYRDDLNQSADVERARMVAELDGLNHAAWAAGRGDAAADPLQVITTLLKIQQRRATLLGTDGPQRVDVSVQSAGLVSHAAEQLAGALDDVGLDTATRNAVLQALAARVDAS